MKPYVVKNKEGEPFAEGMILADGRCFISFLKADYTFVYDNIQQMMVMHSDDGNNEIEYPYHKNQ